MFDIGFLELLLVLVIALIVIGPERMPEVARKLGSFMGKTKRFINSVREDNDWQETVRELKAAVDLQEEKKQLQELEIDLQSSLQEPAHDIDFDSLSRPSFGGAAPSTDTATPSQFSRAPQQPQFPPKPENTPASAASNTSAQASAAQTGNAQADNKVGSELPANNAAAASASSSVNSPTVNPVEVRSTETKTS